MKKSVTEIHKNYISTTTNNNNSYNNNNNCNIITITIHYNNNLTTVPCMLFIFFDLFNGGHDQPKIFFSPRNEKKKPHFLGFS